MAESKAAVEVLRTLAATGELPSLPPGLASADLLAAAREQGLSSLLLRAIEQRPGPWGEAERAPLLAARRGALVRTLGQIGLAARVVALLAARGIRALPLKGAALAETVYDVESDRPMSDVDLLALERWTDGIEALRAEGFALLARGDHAWAFVEPASREIVELHRSVTSCPGLFPLVPDALWERSRPGRGQLARLPSAEDLLVHLALHASFQHGFVLGLVQWLDFRRVLEREAIDLDRLLAVAAESRAVAPLAGALLAAEAVVGARLPPPLGAALQSRVPGGLRRWLEPRLRDPLALVSPAAPDHVRLRWELVPEPGRRARLLWLSLVVPEGPEETTLAVRLASAARRALRFARIARRSRSGESRPVDARPAASAGSEEPARSEATATASAESRRSSGARPAARRVSSAPTAAGSPAAGPHPAPGGPDPDASARRPARPEAAPVAAIDASSEPFRERLLRECLASFPWIRLTVTGRCMQPALDNGEKIHLVAAARRAPQLGDVVLARGPEGLLLHRLVWGPPLSPPGARWRTKADRALLLDPPLAPSDVLATVVAVERRPHTRPRRPVAALLSLGRAVVARLRLGAGAAGAEAAS